MRARAAKAADPLRFRWELRAFGGLGDCRRERGRDQDGWSNDMEEGPWLLTNYPKR